MPIRATWLRAIVAAGLGTVTVAAAEVPVTRPAEVPSTRAVAGSQPVRRGLRLARQFESPTTSAATSRPAATFDASLFDYAGAPTRFVWATPNVSQTLVFGRPPTTRPTAVSEDLNRLPEPVRMVGAEIRWLAFESEGEEWVPALLVTPEGKRGPFPLVVATHGLFSQKMQVVSQVGPALLREGFAVLAIDLPGHGERSGGGLDMLERGNPRQMLERWRRAVVNLRQAMDLARQLEVIDGSVPVSLVGYSLGSWVSTIAGAADARVGSMALLVGGATELSAELLAVPGFASSDPRIAIAAFSPRPVLMVSARNDRTVTPVMAERLHQAAREPKVVRWYDMGHLLRQEAFDDTARWLWEQVLAGREGKMGSGKPGR